VGGIIITYIHDYVTSGYSTVFVLTVGVGFKYSLPDVNPDLETRKKPPLRPVLKK
jgi:hypothetical protein